VRKFLVIAAMVLLMGSAHAQTTKSPESASTTPAVSEPQAAPPMSAPAAPPLETPAAAQGPATQAQPVAAAPTAKPRKRQARRYESDEQKARRIAAKYGISW